MNTTERGKRGEREAERFFRLHGFEVLSRNYRKLSGEIDLILRKGEIVYFVEVKTYNDTFRAEERMDEGKLKRMLLTAEAYLSENALEDVEVRFLLAITSEEGIRVVELNEGIV